MKKLHAFQQSKADFNTAIEILTGISAQVKELGTLQISSSLSLSEHSSDKQFIFGIGLLNSQLNACNELGLPDIEYRELKNKVQLLYTLKNEFTPWHKYAEELDLYSRKVYNLLSDSERFELLDKPTRP